MSFRTHDCPSVPEHLATDVETCQLTNQTWAETEVLTYKIYYNWNFVWLSAGEVTFKIKDEGKQYHFSASGDTYDSYQWFFEVHDRYDAWVDKKHITT